MTAPAPIAFLLALLLAVLALSIDAPDAPDRFARCVLNGRPVARLTENVDRYPSPFIGMLGHTHDGEVCFAGIGGRAGWDWYTGP